MKLAVIVNDMVENVLIADESQQAELEQTLGVELVDASLYGLQIGDMRVNGAWTRNQDGEQITLTNKPTYDELAAKVEEQRAKLAELGVEVD